MNGQCDVIAVDVGNSAIKLAVEIDATIVEHHSRIDRDRWEYSVIEWVRRQLSEGQFGRNQLGRGQSLWRVASVRAVATEQLSAAIRQQDSSTGSTA